MKKCLAILLIAVLALSMFVSCDDKVPQQKGYNDSQEFYDDLNIALEPMSKISEMIGLMPPDDECIDDSEEGITIINFNNYIKTFDFVDGEKEVNANGKYISTFNANSDFTHILYQLEYDNLELIIGEDTYKLDGAYTEDSNRVGSVITYMLSYDLTATLNGKTHTVSITEKRVRGIDSMQIEVRGTLDDINANMDMRFELTDENICKTLVYHADNISRSFFSTINSLYDNLKLCTDVKINGINKDNFIAEFNNFKYSNVIMDGIFSYVYEENTSDTNSKEIFDLENFTACICDLDGSITKEIAQGKMTVSSINNTTNIIFDNFSFIEESLNKQHVFEFDGLLSCKKDSVDFEEISFKGTFNGKLFDINWKAPSNP